ncbi:hypothetical protein ACIHAR_35895 [Streptomyces sp. NPDC052016]|uniref:hypothetical protein n=1 Tax=unclassified Streptomyces TaxID=2593676 RepID=UPI0034269131
MRKNAAALIGMFAALAMALGLGSAAALTDAPAATPAHQVLASDVGPHTVKP